MLLWVMRLLLERMSRKVVLWMESWWAVVDGGEAREGFKLEVEMGGGLGCRAERL